MGKRTKKKSNTSYKHRCVLCGRVLFQFEENYVTGATGRVVCADCLNTSGRLFPVKQPEKQTAKNCEQPHYAILTPQEIIRQLDTAIIGQERAKRAIAVALWKQQLRAAGNTLIPRTNLLLYGPTGCGKTAIVREASKIAGLPFINFDATTLSETGYRGRDAEEMVKDLIDQFRDHPGLSSGIVFLDEFDKLAARGGDVRTEYNRGTQHSLLKLVEGVTVTQDATTLSTNSLLFIFGGAFTDLTDKRESFGAVQQIGFLESQPPVEESDRRELSTDDFISFGIEPELLGRVGQYIPLESLTASDMKKILLGSSLSLYLQYQKFFDAYGITMEFSPKRIDALVGDAVKRGTGARGLNNLVEEAVEPLLFKLTSGTLHKSIQVEDMPYVG